jgi:hypothetical protein
MSQIIASSVLYFFRPEILEDALGAMADRGVSKFSSEYLSLAKIKTQNFFPLLSSSRSILTAVTPWIFKHEDIASARELRFLVECCDSFQFFNYLSIMWIRDEEAARELIPRAIALTSRNLKKLSLVLNHESCLTAEVERMLINADIELPYLEEIELHNNYTEQTICNNKYHCSRDLECYLAILKSDALARTENGRSWLKPKAAQEVNEMLMWDRKRRSDVMFANFATMPATDRSWAEDPQKNRLPLEVKNRVDVMKRDLILQQYLQSKMMINNNNDNNNQNEEDEEAEWESCDDDEEVENELDSDSTATTNFIPGFDIPFIIRHCLQKQKPDFFQELRYIKILAFLLNAHPASSNSTAHTFFTPDEIGFCVLPCLKKEIAPKIAEFLEMSLVEYPKFKIDGAITANVLSFGDDDAEIEAVNSQIKLIEILNKNEMRQKFQSAFTAIFTILFDFIASFRHVLIDDFSESILKSLVEIMDLLLENKINIGDRATENRNAAALSRSKTDIIIGKLLFFFTLLFKEFVIEYNLTSLEKSTLSHAEQLWCSRNEAVFKMIPLDLVAKFLDLDRQSELVNEAIQFLHQAMKTKATTPAELCFSSDILLENLLILLRNADQLSSPMDLLVSDMLTKTVAFDFNPTAKIQNVICFEKWLEDAEWHLRASKKLERAGALEAAFAHLYSFTPAKGINLATSRTNSAEVFSFYIIDALVFSEGLTEEAKRMLNEVAEAKKKSEKNDFDPILFFITNFNEQNAQKSQYVEGNPAIQRIREKIPNAVQTLETFFKRLPLHFRTYSQDRCNALVAAILGEDGMNERKNNAKKNNTFSWGATNFPTANWGVSPQVDNNKNNNNHSWTTTTASTSWPSQKSTSNNNNFQWGSWGAAETKTATVQEEEKNKPETVEGEDDVVWEEDEEEEEKSTKSKKKATNKKKK